MVQADPNLLLTLKHLAPCGAVLTAESQAALDHSLPIKRVEAGLKSLILWGRFTTRNGKDYLVAEGCNGSYIRDRKVHLDTKYYFTQDGVTWLDLLQLDPETALRAARVTTQLSGDPGQQSQVKEADPAGGAAQPAAGEDGGEAEGTTGALVYTISELQRLRYMIDSINLSTAVIPKGSLVVDAYNKLLPNKLFGGLDYPEKLESYQHRSSLPDGPSLAADVRGSWAVHSDPFKGVTVLRSLIYPGYFAYYHAQEHTWGSLYMGSGLRNNDLVFML